MCVITYLMVMLEGSAFNDLRSFNIMHILAMEMY
jgi:hypothetical protein